MRRRTLAWLLVAAAALAGLGYAVFGRSEPPAYTYKLDPTMRCLQAKGYRAHRDGRRYLLVDHVPLYPGLSVYFAPSIAAARRHATADNSVTEPRNQNVVAEWGDAPFPPVISACLRTK